MDYRKLSIALGFVVAILAGCGTVATTTAKLGPRAAYDLDCPEDDLRIRSMDGSKNGAYSVDGCGRRARYEVTDCEYGTCMFSLQSIDGAVRKQSTKDNKAE